MRWTRGRRWLAIGVPALGVLAIGGYALARPSAPVGRPVTVAVQRGTVSVTLSAAGTVQPVQTRGLSFSTAGVVTELHVRAGDTVSAGEVLARIDSTAVQDEVNAAQASVNSATDALARVQQATTGPTVSTCQPAGAAPAAYAVPRGSPSASAPAGASPSPSLSASPTGPPTGQPSRQPTGQPSRQPTGQPSRQPSGQPGGRTGSTCGTGGGGPGGRGGGDSLLSAQQQLTNAQLALRLAQDRLAGTVITAPVAGRVLSVGGTVGAQESPGGNGFIVLGGVAENDVRAQYSEADVGHLAVGQPATITLPDRAGTALAGTPAGTLTGKVSQIDPAGVVSGRLVRYGVVIAFDQAPDDVLLGESATVAVTTAP